MKGGNCFMFNKNWIKVIGIAATIIGMGATLVSDWVGEKKMDVKITEKIGEAFAKKFEKIES